MSPLITPKLIRNPHLQTVLPNLLTVRAQAQLYLTAYDVDMTQQFVLANRPAKTQGEEPILLVIPGIEGSYQSAVVKLLFSAKELCSQSIYALSHRGIHTPNQYVAPYHAALTDDLETVIPILRKKHPKRAIHAVGFSMGANLLLRYLSDNHGTIDRATAISVPFDIAHSVSCTPAVYQKQIIKRIRQRAAIGNATITDIDWSAINGIRDFDGWVTAPYFGFESADDYYEKTSCGSVLERITCPTTIINAADDPFVGTCCWPDTQTLPENVTFLGTNNGGHMGFMYFDKGFHNWIAEIISAQNQLCVHQHQL